MTNDMGYSVNALYMLIWFLPFPGSPDLESHDVLGFSHRATEVVVVFDLPIPLCRTIPIFPVLLFIPLCIIESIPRQCL